MNVAIRVDASLRMGSGHFMRCLCLADAMQAQGSRVYILSANLPAHMQSMVAEKGHVLLGIPTPELALIGVGADAPVEQAWSTDRQLQDAAVCQSTLVGVSVNWVVVDHYGLGRDWEHSMRQALAAHVKILAIDDLAREHDCDVLLDQNFYPSEAAPYRGRVPDGCQILVGPKYALLRPEFHRLRLHMRPRDGAVRRLHIFLGGMDAANMTGTVLDALEIVAPTGLSIDVVIGRMHPAVADIERRCRAMPGATCHIQTPSMATLLAQADLAIGAGGSATWERCALGVPTLALCLAENQRQLLAHCARHGLVVSPDHALTADALAIHIRALLANSALRHMLSRNGMEAVSTQGAQRIVSSMQLHCVSVRKATAQDCALIHMWRNAPQVREMSRHTEVIPFEDHQRWYAKTLKSDNRHLLIGEVEARPIGYVRFDTVAHSAEVSISLAPLEMGHGLGTALLAAAERWVSTECPGIATLQAETLPSNDASIGLFERSGYQRQNTRFSKTIRS